MAKAKRSFSDAITGSLAGLGAASPFARTETKTPLQSLLGTDGTMSWNPWLLAGGAALGAAGNLLGGAAEDEDEGYQLGLEGQRIDNEMGKIGLGQAKRQDRRMRKKETQQDDFGALLGNMFRAAKGGFGDQVMRPA